MSNKKPKFLTGNFTDYIIPPKDIIEKYSQNILRGQDFPNYEYGEMVYRTIDEFIKKYPDLDELYVNKQRCLYKLSHTGFLSNLLSNNNDAETNYIALSYEFALKHKEIPLLAWYPAANFYSSTFTNIRTSNEMRKKAMHFFELMWNGLYGNKYILYYYFKALGHQISVCYFYKINIKEYVTLLLKLIKDTEKIMKENVQQDNEDIKILISLCSSYLLLLNIETDKKLRINYFNKIKTLYRKYNSIEQIISLYNFALIDCIINNDNVNNCIKYYNDLIGMHNNIIELLKMDDWEFDWNYHFEKCEDIRRIKYINNLDKIIKKYPDFPNFIIIQINVIKEIVGYNGNISYRDNVLDILKSMMKIHSKNENIICTYCNCLYLKSHRCETIEESISYINKIKTIFIKMNIPNIAGYYCLGLKDLFYQKRNKLPTNDISSYLNEIVSYYSTYKDNELIIEAYSSYINLLFRADKYKWNKKLEKNEYLYPKLKNDNLYYFNELHTIAKKFSENRDIVNSYLEISEQIIDSINEIDILIRTYNDVIKFSNMYKDDFGDIVYNCNDILEKLYWKFDNLKMKNNCLKGINKIAGNNVDDGTYWVTDFYAELYEKSNNSKEKEKILKFYLNLYNQYPWYTNIMWKYTDLLNNILKKEENLNQKIRLFSMIADCTLKQPGNTYVHEVYAESLLDIVYTVKNIPLYSYYKDAFKVFLDVFPFIIDNMKFNESEKYNELFDSIINQI